MKNFKKCMIGGTVIICGCLIRHDYNVSLNEENIYDCVDTIERMKRTDDYRDLLIKYVSPPPNSNIGISYPYDECAAKFSDIKSFEDSLQIQRRWETASFVHKTIYAPPSYQRPSIKCHNAW